MQKLLTCDEFRARIIAAARECVAAKVPFLHQGRDPQTGLDCIGLVLHAFSAAGWTPRDPESALQTNYKRLPDRELLSECIEKEAFEIPISEAMPGDVFLMKFADEELPRHIALVSYPREGHIYIIQTDWSLGGVAETIWSDAYQKRTVAAYRLWDLKD